MRLPVSGLEAELRPLTGLEDVMLAEAAGPDPAVAVELLERIVQGGGAVRLLPVPDVEALLLELRRRLFGDRIATSSSCTAPGCGARIDIEFSIAEYREHHRPRATRQAEPDPSNPGWFRMVRDDVRFRLPTAADQLDALAKPAATDFLARRVMQPPDAGARVRHRVERAMAALAPPLSAPMEGVCPECGASVALEFDVFSFVMRELKQQVGYFYEDVHAIASAYHWPEGEILAMPSARRARYAALASRGSPAPERSLS